MSEEEQRITKVEKEKDPRRVASGKRLAAVSRLAKEKKAYERQQQQHMERIDEEEDTHDGGYSTITVITGVGVLAGLVCLYFTYKQDKRAQMITNTQPTSPVESGNTPDNTPSTKMISLDE